MIARKHLDLTGGSNEGGCYQTKLKGCCLGVGVEKGGGVTSLINTPGRHYQLFTPRPTPTHKGKSAPGRSTDSLILTFQVYGGKLNFLLMYTSQRH